MDARRGQLNARMTFSGSTADPVADDVVEGIPACGFVRYSGNVARPVPDPDDDRATATVCERCHGSCDAFAVRGDILFELDSFILAAPSNQVKSVVKVLGLVDDISLRQRVRPATADRAEVEAFLPARERHPCIGAAGVADRHADIPWFADACFVSVTRRGHL